MENNITHAHNLLQLSNNILIVDDSLESLRLLSTLLTEQGYKVRPAPNGRLALEAIKRQLPHLIILDIRMPEMDGFELCKRFKANEDIRDVPIIFISGLEEIGDKIKAFGVGGVDYIIKPFQKEEVLARVRTHLNLFNMQTRLEQLVQKKTEALTDANKALQEEISERKHAEEDLKLFRNLLDRSSDAFFVIDPETAQFLNFNESAIRNLGYSREELLGMKVVDIDTTITNHYAWEQLVNEVKSKSYMILEGEHKRKNASTFPIEMNVKFIAYAEKKYIVAVARDITDRKKLEGQLRQAQKMESIGTLAGGIAHDFNNILTSVLGFADLAKMNLATGKDLEKDLDEVIKAGLRARDLVKHILTFSRSSDIQKISIEIRPLIKETLKFLKASLPSTIEVSSDLNVSNSTVMADPTQIHQILMNLCTNASHAMKEKGGVLDLRLKEVDMEDESLHQFKELKRGKYIQLTVADTGDGISKDCIDRIFDPFFTTKEREEGTGMGLSVVHGIVKEMGGAISVYSEPDKGATFQVLFPKYEGEATEVVSPRYRLPRGKGRILFVDDEESIILYGRQILEHIGYQVTTATSSLEALEMFKSHPEEFDLVLTDMTMPKMTGLELSKQLKEIRPNVPIVLSTGFSAGITAEAIRDSGICEMVMKPMIAGELAESVSKALDINPNVA